ncbi:MAG: RNA polymerase sigma factor [Clostridia bacterium]|nr:RNA polymerase sigma factor [Clostridia bacterium]
MDTDQELYRRFLAGDDAAFAALIERYRTHLIFFILRSVRDYDAAEDLAEDVFVEVLLHRRRYNFKAPLKAYLFAIARHKTADHLRRRARHGEQPLETAGDPADLRALEEEFLRKEQAAAVHAALNALPAQYRTVLHLLYFEEMSYEQAGNVMKKNRKQIENLAYRARQALKAALEKEDCTP